MSLSTFQTLIKATGARLKLDDFVAGDSGYLGITVDGHELHLQHEEQGDDVVLFSRLPIAEAASRDAIYAMLLAANVFWQGGRGATFSADPETGHVFLADKRNMAVLDVDRFSFWLETFANVAIHWRDRIASANQNPGQQA